jgi:hypothetical protein
VPGELLRCLPPRVAERSRVRTRRPLKQESGLTMFPGDYTLRWIGIRSENHAREQRASNIGRISEKKRRR